MIREYYVLKVVNEGYWNGFSITRRPPALHFESRLSAESYIQDHLFELNGVKPSIVKIRETIEEVDE